LRLRLSREVKLALLLEVYIGLAAYSVRLGPSSFPYGVSTLIGTSLVALTTLRSSAASSLFSGQNVGSLFSSALVDAQILVTVLCISLLACIEIANPSYEGTSDFLLELRRTWVAMLAVVLVLFAVTVAAKILLLGF